MSGPANSRPSRRRPSGLPLLLGVLLAAAALAVPAAFAPGGSVGGPRPASARTAAAFRAAVLAAARAVRRVVGKIWARHVACPHRRVHRDAHPRLVHRPPPRFLARLPGNLAVPRPPSRLRKAQGLPKLRRL